MTKVCLKMRIFW